MGKFNVHTQTLKVDQSEVINYTILNGVTVYSDAINVNYSTGYSAVIVETASGSMTYTFQISLDGKKWFDPVDKLGNTLAGIGAAVTGDSYMYYSPVPSKYMRIVMVAGSDSVITARLLFQEQL